MPEEHPSASSIAAAPPRPMREKNQCLAAFNRVGPVLLAGGAFVVLVMNNSGGLSGATRSCKLKWEQREQQIEQSVKEHAQRQQNQPPAQTP